MFGRGTRSKPLTEYEQAVNAASLQLSKEDPSLLGQRDKLFEKAREQVRNDGFKFKKGHSRSKFAETQHKDENTIKKNTSSHERKYRLAQIENELDEIKKTIKVKKTVERE